MTLDAITRQADAMAVDIFEIGLYKPAVDGKANEPEMLPRTWDRATLLKSVAWLKYQNSQGRNIYIRPKGEHALSLVDDLNAAALQRMKSEGFHPAIIVETSPGNFQAWLNHGRVLPRAESTAVARALAERFGGDRGAADWRHFGRLAGLTNRKPKYNCNGVYPFVRLVEAATRAYAQGESFLNGVLTNVEITRSPSVPTARDRRNVEGRQLKQIDSFRSNPAYGGDNTRVDLAYALYALAHGATEDEVKDALCSRDLRHKGPEKRQQDYVERTLRKAYAVLDSTPTNRIGSVTARSVSR
jgi:hypothetical protein